MNIKMNGKKQLQSAFFEVVLKQLGNLFGRNKLRTRKIAGENGTIMTIELD